MRLSWEKRKGQDVYDLWAVTGYKGRNAFRLAEIRQSTGILTGYKWRTFHCAHLGIIETSEPNPSCVVTPVLAQAKIDCRAFVDKCITLKEEEFNV